ncbi:hypothetical protein GCM10007417_20600 [Glycocaulis alkaliphilus]|nr:hypothetical protein GCM10007417_20600 [Glycocaulis alkaliphilus]
MAVSPENATSSSRSRAIARAAAVSARLKVSAGVSDEEVMGTNLEAWRHKAKGVCAQTCRADFWTFWSNLAKLAKSG